MKNLVFPNFGSLGFKYSPDAPSGASGASDASAMADITPPKEPAKEPAKDTIDYKAMYEGLSSQFAELQSKQAEAERKAAEKERANKEKNGKFEELYNEQKRINEETTNKFKKTQIENELKLQAKDAGLKKLEYLAMLDREGLDLMDDGTVIGLNEKLTTFKTKYPEFFGEVQPPNAHNSEERSVKVPYTDNKRTITHQSVHYSNTDELTKRLPEIKDGRERRRVFGELAKQKLSKHLFNK